MPSIKELGKDKYRVFLCDGFKPDGKVNRTTKVIIAKSMADAKKQAQALEVDFKRGKQIQLAHSPTFCDLAELWRQKKKPQLEYKTQDRYEGFLEYFMLPYFGRTKVVDIKPYDITDYLQTLSKDGVRKDGKSGGYSEKTIRHHYMFIQSLLRFAVERENQNHPLNGWFDQAL